MKSVNKMSQEVKSLYIMALQKNKPIDFRVWATHKAIMMMFSDAQEEKIGIGFDSNPPMNTWPHKVNAEKVTQMILDYVRFDDE
jgi:hypothetical protein